MSLGTQLDDSASGVRRFIDGLWPEWSDYLLDIRHQFAQAGTLAPAAHEVPNSGYWRTVGVAIDYRLRWYFGRTPIDQLIAYKAAERFGLWVEDEPLFGYAQISDAEMNENKKLAEIFGRRPADYAPHAAPKGHKTKRTWRQDDEINMRSEISGVYMACFDNLERFLDDSKPVGRRLTSAKEEVLARYCIVLARLEAYYRSGKPEILTPLNEAALQGGWKALLEVPSSVEVRDVCDLSKLFHNRNAAKLKQPAVLNPTFAGSAAAGGADGDLLVGGTLIEIKTTKQLVPDKNWFRQLIAYVLLDFYDEYKITEVGLYLTRQGVWITWPLEKIIRAAHCDRKTQTLPEMRLRFRKVLLRELTPIRR